MDFTTDHQQQCPRQPTTGFVLIRTGIIARHCCQEVNHVGLFSYAPKLLFVGKVRKVDTAKLFTAQRLRHCQLIVRF